MSMHMTTLARPPRTGRLMESALGLLTILILAATPLSPAHADSVKGSIFREGTIPAHKIDTYHRAFKGGEKAVVAITTDQDALVKVYDFKNHLVVQQKIVEEMFSDNIPLVSWQPKKTGMFTIKIINQGATPVKFGMRTN